MNIYRGTECPGNMHRLTMSLAINTIGKSLCRCDVCKLHSTRDENDHTTRGRWLDPRTVTVHELGQSFRETEVIEKERERVENALLIGTIALSDDSSSSSSLPIRLRDQESETYLVRLLYSSQKLLFVQITSSGRDFRC